MKRFRLLVAAVAVSMSLGGATLAAADPGAEVRSEHEDLLATPAEMAELDMPTTLVANQRRVLASLTEQERSAQAELRNEAAEVSAPTNIIDLRTNDSSQISPFTYSTLCSTNQRYLVYSQVPGDQCFRGTGTYVLPEPAIFTSYVRPGQTHGRIMYYLASTNATYWSTWRGPSYDKYWFSTDTQVYTYRVQIDACYTAVAC